MPDATGLVLAAATAIAYTAVGGMGASVPTDVRQAVALVGGLAPAVPLALSGVGGVTAATLGPCARVLYPDLGTPSMAAVVLRARSTR